MGSRRNARRPDLGRDARRGKGARVTASRNSTSQKVTVATLGESKRLPVVFLLRLGLYDTSHGVAIPYYSTDGAPIAVKERTALKAKHGSFWPKGVKLAAYGAERIADANKAGFLVAVEGESDCWTLLWHGLPALGIPGAGAARVILPEHVEMISTIYIHVEPDLGGERFLAGVLARLAILDFKGKVFVLRMPNGVKDPADLHCLDPDQFKAKMEQAIQAATPLDLPRANDQKERRATGAPATTNHADRAGRPSITITTEEHEVNAQAVAALVRDDGIYQRGGMLVRVVRDVSPAAKGIRRPFAPRIETLPPPLLRERLAANALWITIQETNEGAIEKRARPPAWCVAAVHARADWPGIRHLEAVVD
jgi:hypothetical protein